MLSTFKNLFFVPSASPLARQDSKPYHQYTLEEVAEHSEPWDCWCIIFDKVYNVTELISSHPGGSEILMEYAGRDATLAFRSVGHTKSAVSSLASYIVGELVEEDRMNLGWSV
ncbi:unnamed protein product [Cyprideis torosa]|uniref:Uncharacterized protein n=1 Tax=Cyprideis torosa TaxID=163714 RepID=A0A7R8W942_9CRUS|nr:unnamed protein product [Cyprideis torosa]CAG0889359.1 unnamed protein product [Cyprideis torosa]